MMHLRSVASHVVASTVLFAHKGAYCVDNNLTQAAEVYGAQPVVLSNTRQLANSQTWAFKWPYDSDGSCACEQVPWGEFTTEAACLTGFAASPFESCSVNFVKHTVGCSFAVSINEKVDNAECKQMCQTNGAVEDAAFKKKCSMVGYHVLQGAVVPSQKDGCFNNWIYGQSDDLRDVPNRFKKEASAMAFYRVIPNIYTAADCQLRCQRDEKCAHWTLRRIAAHESSFTGVVTEEDVGQPFNCHLQSFEAIELAIRTGLTGVPDKEDPRWRMCNFSRCEKCTRPESRRVTSDASTCSVCGCEPRCVWKSTEHIGGPKYCASPHSNCAAPKKLPTPWIVPPAKKNKALLVFGATAAALALTAMAAAGAWKVSSMFGSSGGITGNVDYFSDAALLDDLEQFQPVSPSYFL